MINIRFVQPSGEEQVVTAQIDSSVMEAAMAADIPGITAECGGAASCGTCHAYVDPEWVDRIPPAEDMEQQMLEFVIEPRENSRLTCQIKVVEALDGIRFELPPG